MSEIPSHIPADEHVGTDLLFEDEDVRIWSIVLEPGQTAPLHTHRLDYFVMALTNGRNRRGNGDGTVDIMESKRGTVRFDQVGAGQTHDLTNVSEATYRNIIVELKR